MNKIAFLFFCLFLFYFRAGATENQEIPQITIRFENKSLDSALYQLERQSGYLFVYQDTIVNETNVKNQKFKNKTLVQVLDVLFTSTNYTYIITSTSPTNPRINVFKKFADSSNNHKNQEIKPFLITGKVIDENGKFVYGASIIKKEDTNCHIVKIEEFCTITDKNGAFVISTTNPNAYVIVMYLGYLPRVVPIKDAGLIKIVPDEVILNKIMRFD